MERMQEPVEAFYQTNENGSCAGVLLASLAAVVLERICTRDPSF